VIRQIDIMRAVAAGISNAYEISGALFPDLSRFRSTHGGPDKGEIRASWQLAKLEHRGLLREKPAQRRSARGKFREFEVTDVGRQWVRIQSGERGRLSRAKGSRKQPGIVCSRPGPLGNPFAPLVIGGQEFGRGPAVALFKVWADAMVSGLDIDIRTAGAGPVIVYCDERLRKYCTELNPLAFYGVDVVGKWKLDQMERAKWLGEIRRFEALVSRRAFCWCPLDSWCHVDVLLGLDRREVCRAHNELCREFPGLLR